MSVTSRRVYNEVVTRVRSIQLHLHHHHHHHQSQLQPPVQSTQAQISQIPSRDQANNMLDLYSTSLVAMTKGLALLILATTATALPSGYNAEPGRLSIAEPGRLVPRQCGVQGNNPPTFRQVLAGDGAVSLFLSLPSLLPVSHIDSQNLLRNIATSKLPIQTTHRPSGLRPRARLRDRCHRGGRHLFRMVCRRQRGRLDQRRIRSD